MSLLPYVCPAGFDCIYASSCPAPILPCPAGFFCSTYANSKDLSTIDYQYAQKINGDATQDDAYLYTEPGRYVQTSCFKQFFCPTGIDVEPCEAGFWCSEQSVSQVECDGLSICPELSYYQVNFVNFLIMILMTLAIAIVSVYMIRKQYRAQSLTQVSPARDNSSDGAKQSQISDQFSKQSVDVPGIRMKFSSVTIEKGNRTILPGISGHLPANKVSCLLGPMSCGKSTLLQVLRSGCQGCSSGRTILETTVNGEVIPVSSYSRFVGFVPQEDILDRALTVRETLLFNARIRVPELYDNVDAANAVVTRVLKDLAISHIADTIIGGGPNSPANISGGQVKRVNIAVELVALTRPGVLLLDEPTSGLDASVALDLMHNLQSLSQTGITILMVLQQPRPEIYDALDQLFLMQSDGHIVYQGPSSQAASFLTSVGYPQPSESSDADFCIDVLNDIVDFVATAEGRSSQLSTQAIDLLSAWEKSEWNVLASREAAESANDRHSFGETGDGNRSQAIRTGLVAVDSSWQQQAWRIISLSAKRLLRVRFRNRTSLITYFCIQSIMAMALASGFSVIIQGSYLDVLRPPETTDLSGYYPSPLINLGNGSKNIGDLGFTQLLFFVSGAVGCAAALSAVPVFSGENGLTSRMVSAGLSPISIGIGKIAADTVFVVWNAMVFCGVWSVFGHPGMFCDWIAVVVLASFAASGFGYIFGVLTSPANASVYSIIVVFIFCVFSGVKPTLKQVQRLAVVNWIWYISFATWTAETTYITWTDYLRTDHGEDTVASGADFYGYDISSYGRSVGALLIIGFGLRAIAIALLWMKTKK